MAMLKPRLAGSFEKTPAPGRGHRQPSSTLNSSEETGTRSPDAWGGYEARLWKQKSLRHTKGQKNILSLTLKMLET